MKTELISVSRKKLALWAKAKEATQCKRTPVLVMDANMVRQDFAAFRSAFPASGIFYALKANSDPLIAKIFRDLGSGFEVGSEGALRLLLDIGVTADRIISGNPLKTPEFIQHAYSIGVRKFTFDSYPEIQKMARLSPEAQVYVRIAVSNNYSEWPLDKKFGVEEDKAADMLVEAARAGLHATGIAFHPGSQCVNVAGWVLGLKQCKRVWEEASGKGITLSSLNLGGGFPSEYTKPVPDLSEIAAVVSDTVNELFPRGTEILLEPGRGLVGDDGVMVTTVIAKAAREGQNWLYLDAGVFNGLMESIGGIRYPMLVEKKGKPTKYTVAGPSCDSMDVLPGQVELPELEIGDRVYIMAAGAYTTAYASRFDGIAIPEVLLV
ncbi:MAG: type III PLP-dependent enzyme [Dehalococcoidia bacterium]|nr:type III PLP-dependent enzyme [Dehalococcoidia bacterium]